MSSPGKPARPGWQSGARWNELCAGANPPGEGDDPFGDLCLSVVYIPYVHTHELAHHVRGCGCLILLPLRARGRDPSESCTLFFAPVCASLSTHWAYGSRTTVQHCCTACGVQFGQTARVLRGVHYVWAFNIPVVLARRSNYLPVVLPIPVPVPVPVPVHTCCTRTCITERGARAASGNRAGSGARGKVGSRGRGTRRAARCRGEGVGRAWAGVCGREAEEGSRGDGGARRPRVWPALSLSLSLCHRHLRARARVHPRGSVVQWARAARSHRRLRLSRGKSGRRQRLRAQRPH